jgi:hypothetical protein
MFIHVCEGLPENGNPSLSLPTQPSITAPIGVLKLNIRQTKELILNCMSNFKFYGYRTNKKCCQISQSNDLIQFPIGHVIVQINDIYVADYSTNELHYALSRAPLTSEFKVLKSIVFIAVHYIS